MSKKTSKRSRAEEDDFISHQAMPFRRRLRLPRESNYINTALRRFQPRVYSENRKAFSTHSNFIAAVALYMVWYDSRLAHQTLRATLAMEAKITNPI
jgi:hypothetical protein